MNLRDVADVAAQCAWRGLIRPASVAIPGPRPEIVNSLRYLLLNWDKALHVSSCSESPVGDDFRTFASELFVGGLFLRVSLAVLAAPSPATDSADGGLLALLRDHQRLCGQLLSRTAAMPASDPLAVEQLRRRLEHWTDVLLSMSPDELLVHPFVHQVDRARQFADEGPVSEEEFRLRAMGLRLAVPNVRIAQPLRAAAWRGLASDVWSQVRRDFPEPLPAVCHDQFLRLEGGNLDLTAKVSCN